MPAPIQTIECGNVLVTIWRGPAGRLQVTIHQRDEHSRTSAWPCGTFYEEDVWSLMMALEEACVIARSERALARSPGEPPWDSGRQSTNWRHRARFLPSRARW